MTDHNKGTYEECVLDGLAETAMLLGEYEDSDINRMYPPQKWACTVVKKTPHGTLRRFVRIGCNKYGT